MFANSIAMGRNMSDLCRVCLLLPEESQYLDLTTIYDEEDNLTYGECFTICTQIDLSSGEDLPHNLCKPCGLQLQMSYDFHKKIEESKRLIKKYQKQLKLDRTKLTAFREESKKFNITEEEKASAADLNEKYIISVEEQLPDEAEDMCVLEEEFVIPLYEETNEIEIIDINQTETSLETQVLSPDNNSKLIDTIKQSDEVHLDIEDYQNLEEEEKIRKLDINVNFKKEIFNEDELSAAAMAEAEWNHKPVPAIGAQSSVQIKTELLNRQIDNNAYDVIAENSYEIKNIGAFKITDEIKIEDQVLSEYIVPNPTPLSNLIPSNKKHQGKRIGPPFNCEYCGYSLPTRNALYKHFQRKHKYEKRDNSVFSQLNCPSCSKVFVKVSSLLIHIEEKHSEKKFACEHCGHTLPTKNALYQHRLRKHPDVKKYQNKAYKFKCYLCSECFITAEILNLHKRTIHRKNPVITDMFQCKDCGHKLPTKNALCQHRLRKHRNKKVTKSSYRGETVYTSYERLGINLQESHEILPALKKMVERF